jgi:hypothetical protein
MVDNWIEHSVEEEKVKYQMKVLRRLKRKEKRIRRDRRRYKMFRSEFAYFIRSFHVTSRSTVRRPLFTNTNCVKLGKLGAY